MKKSKLVILAGTALLSVGVLAACGSSKSGSKSTGSSSDEKAIYVTSAELYQKNDGDFEQLSESLDGTNWAEIVIPPKEKANPTLIGFELSFRGGLGNGFIVSSDPDNETKSLMVDAKSTLFFTGETTAGESGTVKGFPDELGFNMNQETSKYDYKFTDTSLTLQDDDNDTVTLKKLSTEKAKSEYVKTMNKNLYNYVKESNKSHYGDLDTSDTKEKKNYMRFDHKAEVKDGEIAIVKVKATYPGAPADLK